MSDTTVHEVVLVEASNVQRLQAWRNQWPQWGTGYTLDQFVSRELSLLSDTGMGRSLTQWVLVPASNPTTADILASVEFFRRLIFVKHEDGGKAELAIGYSIASVFTPAEKRGRGYAGRMMRLLHEKICQGKLTPGETADPPKDIAVSFLYSDIGPDFYARLGPRDDAGWVVTGVRTTKWSAKTLAALPVSSATAQPLRNSDVKAVSTSDQEMLQRELESPEVAAPAFVVLPTPGTFDWIVDRADAWERVNGRPRHETWGFIIGDIGQPDSSFVLFTYEGQKSYLKLTRLRIAPGKQQTHVPELLRRVGKVAVEKGYHTVVGWQVAQAVLDALPDSARGETADRTDSLSALKTYGNLNGSTMTWLANEGYAWC